MKSVAYLAVAVAVASMHAVSANMELTDGCPSCSPLIDVAYEYEYGTGKDGAQLCAIAKKIADCDCGEYETPVLVPFVNCICDPQQDHDCVFMGTSMLVDYNDLHHPNLPQRDSD